MRHHLLHLHRQLLDVLQVHIAALTLHEVEVGDELARDELLVGNHLRLLQVEFPAFLLLLLLRLLLHFVEVEDVHAVAQPPDLRAQRVVENPFYFERDLALRQRVHGSRRRRQGHPVPQGLIVLLLLPGRLAEISEAARHGAPRAGKPPRRRCRAVADRSQVSKARGARQIRCRCPSSARVAQRAQGRLPRSWQRRRRRPRVASPLLRLLHDRKVELVHEVAQEVIQHLRFWPVFELAEVVHDIKALPAANFAQGVHWYLHDRLVRKNHDRVFKVLLDLHQFLRWVQGDAELDDVSALHALP
mmetsp:Transcript_29754/g.63348  ORF Transcript_29754/g.63348 Transcript_29754/m.63348 type:complete len:302 (-) Transcript_29754:360-1265(-)